ncbi:thiamine pyrophosphate-binding protein [Alkalihalobacillus deserti]|uniref:thiamine pyrophosphate-binding protein n=1 Tax=Alkalihalobacillus deserti TaxID=2879466 RepID=UPI001D159508|nr:thiamine pyrophosphate-binding protein [Alkalihalobacillus deserti]
MKKLVSQLLVKYLEDRGVEHIFGLCGHTNIAVLTELEKSSIRFINVRHEQIASHAADGYARVKKETSVVLSHVGPGMTNAATGVANAALDSIPMVVIAGDIPSHYYGKHPHQEINLHSDAAQVDVYKPFVKRAWRVERPEHVAEILEKAFQLAESGNPGPVLVSVPMDIFSKEVEESTFERVKHHTKQLEKPSIDDVTAKKVIQKLVDAKNPVIYVGGGVVLANATAELKELVDHLGIPVAHSLMGKGVLPDDHPLTLGMTGFWGTKFINEKTRTADWILGLGTRFAEADSSSWEPEYTFDIPNTKLIQIDIDSSEIGRNYPAEMGIVADLKQALKVINRVAKELYPDGFKNELLEQEIAKVRAEFINSNQQFVTDNAFPMQPQRILSEVREVLPRDAYITTDVGWNKNGVGQQFPIYTPGSVLTPGGFATMGFGAPAALGAKVANPEKVVVSLVGDGGFGQNPALLATAREENIPVVWVVMNNSAFGTIAGLQKAHFGTTLGTLFHADGESYSPDYAAIAKAYGIEGIKVNSAEEFKPALEKAIAMNKPVVLDVPMINNPTPTSGHWNIMDIYSPGKKVHHVTT